MSYKERRKEKISMAYGPAQLIDERWQGKALNIVRSLLNFS